MQVPWGGSVPSRFKEEQGGQCGWSAVGDGGMGRAAVGQRDKGGSYHVMPYCHC